MEHIDNFHYFEDYKILEFEQEHIFNFEGISFIAIPDLVVYNPQKKFTLIDHKISKLWAKKELQKKKRQLYIYSLPIQNKYNKKVERFEINHFKDNVIVPYEFVDDEFEEAREWVHIKVNEIEKETEFIPRCEIVKDKTKDFYATQLCSHRHQCEFRPFK